LQHAVTEQVTNLLPQTLLLFLFLRHHLAVLVETAVGANPVRQHRLLAARTILDLDWLDVLMAPAFALTGMGDSSLRDCHDSCLLGNLRSKGGYGRAGGKGCQGDLSLRESASMR